jgi:hypothetical protein
MTCSSASLHLITGYPENELGVVLYGALSHDAMEVGSGIDEV